MKYYFTYMLKGSIENYNEISNQIISDLFDAGFIYENGMYRCNEIVTCVCKLQKIIDTYGKDKFSFFNIIVVDNEINLLNYMG